METRSYGFGYNQAIYNLIPEGSNNILDVGCSEGGLIHMLKTNNKASEAVGIEIDSEAAKKAQKVADKVININVEKENLPEYKEYFDYITFADVIEHMVDPWNIILKFKKMLKPSGKMIFCIPNTRNLILITDLIRGDWKYRQAGLMDKTHLRFFTLKSMLRMFEETNMKVRNVINIFKPASWYQQMDGDRNTQIDSHILNLYDVIAQKVSTNQDYSQEIKQILGNYSFAKQDVVEMLSGQFVIEVSKKETS